MNPAKSHGPVRLGLLAASPVYYNLPLFRALEADPRVDFDVTFASSGGVRPFDDGYGHSFAWDVNALEGYRSKFLKRAETNPIAGPFFSLHDWDIIADIRRERYEVLWVFGYNFLTHIMAVAAQRAHGGHVLFREEQTTLHPRSLPKTVVKEVALRKLFAQGSALYIGSENRRWFEHYGVPDDRLFFTPYAVDNERLQTEAARLSGHRSELKREFGISDSAGPVVLTVGRLIPKKQPFFLLEAYRRVRSQMPAALLIVGSGELEEAMRVKVEEEEIPDVVFAGFLNQSEVTRAYACADVFALLSRENETFGLATNEAMNFRLPVLVSTKVGCAPDLVSHGLNGFIAPAHDCESAAGLLRRLVADQDLRARMGAESLKRVETWTGDRAAGGVLAATADVVGPERWEGCRV